MTLANRLTVVALCCALPMLAAAQVRRPDRPDTARVQDSARAGRDTTSAAARDSLRSGIRDFLTRVQEAPVVTRHTSRASTGEIRYTATTGMLPIRNDTTGAIEGGMFFVYYARDGVGDASRRPLLVAFNGGPGSASVWLHLGAYGPRKVRLLPDGSAPTPPYTLEDNPHTLLDQMDIVFIDPVGTGYSRAARPELGQKFWGLDEDISSVGEFIRLFLTRYNRWSSPLFLSGESYGTTRAAGLAGYLAERGIVFNGVMLISAVLNRGASSLDRGNDIAFVNFLPSYAATAWYHKRLPPDLQSRRLEQVVDEVEQWALGDYNVALAKGARLTTEEFRAVAQRLARYTGLSEDFVAANDLRITLPRFNHELLVSQRRLVGRLDSRFTTFETDPGAERGALDPSEATIRNSFTPVMNDYVRRELRYRNDDVYYILGGGIGRWRYPQQQGYSDVTPALERAFTRNPYMRLYVAMGYYDMATPYFAVEHTLAHMQIAPEVRGNIVTEYFASGHMMYVEQESMAKLRAGIRRFIDEALRQPAVAGTATPARAEGPTSARPAPAAQGTSRP
ncbi:MAG TPA: hypothetical protein VHM67_11440 [Gemmatimonadaceae bacterium]|nr:hypothetical protein [Gemmatimonadaceae bacterium]